MHIFGHKISSFSEAMPPQPTGEGLRYCPSLDSIPSGSHCTPHRMWSSTLQLLVKYSPSFNYTLWCHSRVGYTRNVLALPLSSPFVYVICSSFILIISRLL